MSPTTARNDPYQLVTDTILAHLARGVIPWRCPWNRSIGRPRNFHSNREYQGVNVLLLGLQQFDSPWWMTFRQLQEHGGKVRQGEHGIPIMKWGLHQKTLKNGDGTEEKKSTFFLKSYRVFNAVQIEGIAFPELEQWPQLDSAQRIGRAQQMVERMPQPPIIKEGRTTQASYRPKTDTVAIPAFTRFQSPEDYHLTLFHELTHSTGHRSRLNRKVVMESNVFKESEYSQEELIAEMGAAFLGMEADIVRDQHEGSAAYLKSWLDALGKPEHRRWIVLAANQAGRAVDFILGQTREEHAVEAGPPQPQEQNR
ncbi:MAG: ArdC-like ssDNA-binding domain-containing protein [Chthoniobacter sp.]